MAGSTITVDVKEVAQNLERFDQTIQAQLQVVGSTISGNMESYAKANHPWKNRSSSAQNQLKGDFKVTDNELDIFIGHGADYGYWLEKRKDFNGKYQILEKARDSEVNNFKNMLRNMF